jgi:RES domain
VSSAPDAGPPLWRVGYHLDPLGFTPHELYGFNHRFDDIQRRFRTLYLAELPETCLREVLADFRPNLAARQRHIQRYGPDAAEDFADMPVTAKWRVQHVLVAAMLHLDGPMIDLDDVATRQKIEDRHAGLLLEYGLQHLDLHEITTGRRPVTQTIAAELFDRGAAAIRFPSRLDGNPCVALFEGRGSLSAIDAPIALTDPPPRPLINVAEPWGLLLEPAP